MIKLKCFCFALLWLFVSFNSAAQVKSDPDKIKAHKIRSATKISTDLRGLEGIPIPVNVLLYDENGRQTENLKYHPNGSIEVRYIYKYDDKGNRVEVTGITGDESFANKWLYEYDDQNNLVRQTSYRPDGKIGKEHHFSYDENGNRLSEYIYENKKLVEKIEYIYEYYDIRDY